MAKSAGNTNKKMVGVDTTAFTPKVQPPKNMTKDGKMIWKSIVEMIPNENIMPSDFPLMESYCETMVQFRRATQQINIEGAIIDDKLSPAAVWMDKCSARLATLAAKLRLAPNARKELVSTHGKTQKSISTTPLGKLLNG